MTGALVSDTGVPRDPVTTPYVAVSGPSAPGDAAVPAAARALGAGLARRGWYVLTGGGGGVMAATAAGAAEAGGTAIGVLPGTDRRAASPGHTVVLPTGMGEMRNALLVRCADAVVSVGASWGTHSEVALAVSTGVPVVALYADLPAFSGDAVTRADSADHALALLDDLLPGPRG